MRTFATPTQKRSTTRAPRRHPARRLPSQAPTLHLAEIRHILHGPRLQPKLTVGAPDDAYEREADRVADAVLRMPEPEQSHDGLLQRAGEERLQRVCPECEEELERQPEEQELRTKREAAEDSPSVAGGALEARIRGQCGSGQPLPPSARAFFEPRFGCGFDDVRVHTGNRSTDLAQSLHARAFTVGGDVVFGAGEYQPHSVTGRRLLAHELTHVVQQGSATYSPGLARSPRFLPGRNGETTLAGVPVAHHLDGDTIQRQTQRGQPPTTFEEWLICLAICTCDTIPFLSAIGTELRQLCVSTILGQVDASVSHLSTIKSEVNFDMTRTPPVPIMSSSQPLRPASRWGVYHYIRRNMPNFVPGTGQIRRPDVIISRNPLLPPTQPNIRTVVEIKFPGDTLSQAQEQAYRRIAGAAARFLVLTPGPESCNCEEMRRVLAEALALALEIAVLAALIAALVADDATVVGAVDDVAIPPLAARLAIVAARLGSLIPRMAPAIAPLLQGAR
jgi:hypothetical protein